MHPVFSYRLTEYVGDSFLIGAGGASVFHLVKGLRNSPNGGRLAGAVRTVGANVPRFAGSCAVYAAVFCAVETAVSRARRRDQDHWDSIAAGAASSGLFGLRRGAAGAARSWLLGATMFAGVAAFNVWINRLLSCCETQSYRPLPAPAAVITEVQLEGQEILLYGAKV